MKIKSLISLIALTLTSTLALAHEHSVEVCSTTNKKVCAHLGFEKPLNTKEEGEFIAHVTTPNNALISYFKLDLWMEARNGRGHGSSPVEIKDSGKNIFKISNAWFTMPGTWLVRLEFDFEGRHERLQIPVQIQAR